MKERINLLPLLIAGVVTAGMFTTLIVTDLKKYEEERNNINIAQKISHQNNTVNRIINIDSAINGRNINSSLSNSALLTTKPISFKIVNFENGESEKVVVNKYSTAVKEIFKTKPNSDITCSLLAETQIITIEECNQVHDKEYDFYHKTQEGNVAYEVSNEKVGKYITEMEANRYNLETTDISVDKKIVLDKNYIATVNKFLTKKNKENKENEIERVKNFTKNGDYLLASAEIYNMKKHNYQYTPLISNLYLQLLDDIEAKTSDAVEGTEDYQIRLKVQAEFIKLTKSSNMLSNMETKDFPLADKFIKSIATNYAEIQTIELIARKSSDDSVNILPSLGDYKQSITLMGTNVSQIK